MINLPIVLSFLPTANTFPRNTLKQSLGIIESRTIVYPDRAVGWIRGTLTENHTPINYPCEIRCYSDSTGKIVTRIKTTTNTFSINGLPKNDRYTCIAIDGTGRVNSVSLSNIIPK